MLEIVKTLFEDIASCKWFLESSNDIIYCNGFYNYHLYHMKYDNDNRNQI